MLITLFCDKTAFLFQYKKSKIWEKRLDILESIVKIQTLITKTSRLIVLNFQL